MKRMLKKLLSVAIAAALVVGLAPATSNVAKAADATSTTASISYGNSDWSISSDTAGAVSTPATVTGAGKYTVSLDLSKVGKAVGDVAFCGLIVKDAAKLFPGYVIKIDDIQLNGAKATFVKGYTNDEDGAIRMNIHNSYVTAVPDDARSYDGSVKDASWKVLSAEQLKDVKTISITFQFIDPNAPKSTTASISYGNSDWSISSDTAGAVSTPATVTGEGKYTVSLDMSKVATATGEVAFCGLIVKDAATMFPGYTIKIDDVQLNGAKADFVKGYTNDEDGAIRMNIHNSYVTAVPDDARSYDGSVKDATWKVLSAAQLKDFKSLAITFEFIKKADTKPAAVKLSVSKSKVTVAPGKSVSLTYKASSLKDVKFKSSNTKVATVKKTSNGKIKVTVAKGAKKGAKATITLTLKKEKVSVKVTVGK